MEKSLDQKLIEEAQGLADRYGPAVQKNSLWQKVGWLADREKITEETLQEIGRILYH